MDGKTSNDDGDHQLFDLDFIITGRDELPVRAMHCDAHFHFDGQSAAHEVVSPPRSEGGIA